MYKKSIRESKARTKFLKIENNWCVNFISTQFTYWEESTISMQENLNCFVSKSGDSICSEGSFPCFVKGKWVSGLPAATRWGWDCGVLLSCLTVLWSSYSTSVWGHLATSSLTFHRHGRGADAPSLLLWECLRQCPSCQEYSISWKVLRTRRGYWNDTLS